MLVIHSWLEASWNFRRKFIQQLFGVTPKSRPMRMVSHGFYVDDSMLENPLSRAILNALHDQSIYQQKTMWVSE